MRVFWQISHSWMFLFEIVLSSSVSIVFFLTLFTLSYTLAFSLCVILFIIFLSIFLSSTLSLFFSLSLPLSLTVLVSPSLSLSLSLSFSFHRSLSCSWCFFLSFCLYFSLSLPPSLSLVWICPCFCSQSVHSSIVEQLSLCRVKIRQQRKFELTPSFNGPRVTVGWDRPVPAMLRKLCPDSNLMLNFPVKRQDEVNARKRYKIFGIGEAVDLLFLPLESEPSFL